MARKVVSLTDDKGAGWGSPSPSAAVVVPSDTADLPNLARIYVGGAGDLTVLLANDATAVTFTAADIGYHPLIVKRVLATGTTATSMVALYME